jgi:hypothetical protein
MKRLMYKFRKGFLWHLLRDFMVTGIFWVQWRSVAPFQSLSDTLHSYVPLSVTMVEVISSRKVAQSTFSSLVFLWYPGSPEEVPSCTVPSCPMLATSLGLVWFCGTYHQLTDRGVSAPPALQTRVSVSASHTACGLVDTTTLLAMEYRLQKKKVFQINEKISKLQWNLIKEDLTSLWQIRLGQENLLTFRQLIICTYLFISFQSAHLEEYLTGKISSNILLD